MGRCDLDLPATGRPRQIQPVTANEIRKRVKMKPNGAPGPDGMKKSNILNFEEFNSLMAGVANLLLNTGHYPELWKCNTTSLIPKDGKDLKEASGWRPITIGNLLGRLYSSLVESRIKSSVKIILS